MIKISGADWFSRRGQYLPTTRGKDELSVSCNTKAGDSYCSLSPARPFIEASTDLSEELPKKRRRTEVSVQLAAMVPHRQALFQNVDVGSYREVPSTPELCISVRQWPGRLGHRAHQPLDRKGTPVQV